MPNSSDQTRSEEPWPQLPLAPWQDTYATLHRWLQVVGKIRLARMPWINHSWHVPLYISARGLTTGLMPAPDGGESFQIELDFIEHRLRIDVTDGRRRELTLEPMTVAAFYTQLFTTLRELAIDVTVNPMPNEIPDATRLDRDAEHASYDADAAHRFWRALVAMEPPFTRFRARFKGKCSPVHFFWGSFDLAVTRFSGRAAPPHPGGVPGLPDWVTREAYSEEVSSAGFWPGGGPMPQPVFYSYAYPTPEGFAQANVEPADAFFSEALGEFVLPYDAVRQAANPDQALLAFLQSTYEAAADAAGWDRAKDQP
jgi:hypothetical protein